MIPLYLVAAVGLFFVPAVFAWLAGILLAYNTAAAMLFAGTTRYRIPYDFLLALLAGGAIERLLRSRSAGPADRPYCRGTRMTVVQAIRSCSRATLVLVAAVPFLFLHPTYQPSLRTGRVTWNLTDIAVAAVVAVAAFSVGFRAEARRALARSWIVWLALGLFLVWALASLAWARTNASGYPTGTRLVSALKLVELALLYWPRRCWFARLRTGVR